MTSRNHAEKHDCDHGVAKVIQSQLDNVRIERERLREREALIH